MPSDKRPFVFSLTLHVCAIAGMGIFVLLQGCQETQLPEHVFELISELPQIQEPVKAAPVTKPSPLPELVQPKWIEPKPPVEAPQMRPKAQPKTKPIPKPAPKVKPQVKRTTAASFFNKHPQADPPRQEKPKPSPKTVTPRPQFDTSEFTKVLRQSVQPIQLSKLDAKLSTHERNALIAYGNQLRAAIQQRWDGSGSLAAEAILEIQVSGAGAVSGRIIRSSGDQAFDQSILEALKRVRRMPAPPSGNTHTFTLPFSRKSKM